MTHDSDSASLNSTGHSPDSLSELLRSGARQLLAQAVEAEIQGFLQQHEGQRLEDGRQGIVRNGYLPTRPIQTGVGAVDVQVPRVRDRTGGGVQFRSTLLPPYIRRSPSVAAVLPWLSLKGVSTGDFSAALSALLGEQATGLSSSTISRLKRDWEQEYTQWRTRALHDKRYVYLWADGIYFNVRLDDARQCLLVVIGVATDGHKEFLAIEDGFRESEQSWTELLQDLQARGLEMPPQLAVGDGALGFWKALGKLFPDTRHQRCWVHKTANVLNKLPKGVQAKAKSDLHQIWMAETRADATQAFATFIAKYQGKFPKAVECLTKDRDELLAFYDFPAEHWTHIRSSNPIESTFATIRLRTAKTRGCLSRTSGLSLVFKLALAAEHGWRRLRGFHHLPTVAHGVPFPDGIATEQTHNDHLAA